MVILRGFSHFCNSQLLWEKVLQYWKLKIQKQGHELIHSSRHQQRIHSKCCSPMSNLPNTLVESKLLPTRASERSRDIEIDLQNQYLLPILIQCMIQEVQKGKRLSFISIKKIFHRPKKVSQHMQIRSPKNLRRNQAPRKVQVIDFLPQRIRKQAKGKTMPSNGETKIINCLTFKAKKLPTEVHL